MKYIRALFSRFIEVASTIVPKRAHVVLHGYPADEGNIVEVAGALHKRYPGKIFWLVDQRDTWVLRRETVGLYVLPKYSLRGLWKYLTAEAVFFSHGLYGDPRPRRGQTIVNLWHGDGFKIMKEAEDAKRSIYPAQFTVGCSRLLTLRRAAGLKMTEAEVLLVGNARMDQFYVPLTEETRGVLGLERKFVVWLPTFRSNHGAGVTKGWADVKEGAPNPNLFMNTVSSAFARAGITLVVKPHPQDRESRDIDGALILDNSDLEAAGTTLYTLLGHSSGIITDYSSVWTEYLALDRPIGFVVPDLKEYQEGRGLFPADIFEWLPGPILEDQGSIAAFIADVDAREDTSQFGRLRAQAAEKLGLIHSSGRNADALLDLLNTKDTFRRAGGLGSANGLQTGSQSLIVRRQNLTGHVA